MQAAMPLVTTSILSSPASTVSSRSSDGLPFPRNTSMSDFEIEHMSLKSPPSKARRRGVSSDFDSETSFRANVSALIAAKARPFVVSGRIPVDPSALTLFFRPKSGITHSVDFPIDVDYDMPPALDVLMTACQPHLTTPGEQDNESLFYPPSLPLTTTLELANHPILDAVRNNLFPVLPAGHYVTAMRDKLEICTKGNRIPMQPRPTDGRIATIIVLLPVRYRGGALAVRGTDGSVEKFYARGGKPGDLEWTAIMADCDHEVEPVLKGCRLSVSYAVHTRSFGPSGLQPDPLISASNNFLDALSAVLNSTRGRRIAFYLTGEYTVNPAEELAESLVPSLRGGDSVLYHAVKTYKLSPELRWAAGGYVWPVDQTVDFSGEPESPRQSNVRMPFSVVNGGRVNSAHGRIPFGTPPSDAGSDDVQDLRTRVHNSGAIPLAETDIMLLNDINYPGPVSKARVPFVSCGEMEKLVVNVLLVVFVQ